MQAISSRFFNKQQDCAGKSSTSSRARRKPAPKGQSASAIMAELTPLNTLAHPFGMPVPRAAVPAATIQPVPAEQENKVVNEQQLARELREQAETLKEQVEAVAHRVENHEPILSTEFKRAEGIAERASPESVSSRADGLKEVKQTLKFEKISPDTPSERAAIVSETEPSTEKRREATPKPPPSRAPREKCSTIPEKDEKTPSVDTKKEERKQKAAAAKLNRPKEIHHHTAKPNFVRQNLKKSYMQRSRPVCHRQRSFKSRKFFAMQQRAKEPRIRYEGLGAIGLDGPVLDSKAKASLIVFSEGYKKGVADFKAAHLNLKNKADDAELLQVLKDSFGFESFRPGQLEAIKFLLAGNSSFVIQATGTGKSLIYQYLSLVLDGVVLVVTPLISLMNDQVLKMPKWLAAACLNSYQTRDQRDEVMSAYKTGRLNVIMMSPERLFLEGLDYSPVKLICVDEAHCVSEWSHNFRPSYLRLEALLREKVPHVPRLALTATATVKTVISVCSALQIQRENVIKADNISRTNLFASVTRDTDKCNGLVKLLKSDRYKKLTSLIVYCTYKRTTEFVKRQLNQNGITAEAYHAGLSDMQRQKVHKGFEDNLVRVLVATIAFGMGIDKHDIQGIIHYDMPKSIENYLQEIGRAGRDGKPAFCHMFLSPNDLYEIRKLVMLDHVDYEGVNLILQRAMATAYSKHCGNNVCKTGERVTQKRMRVVFQDGELANLTEDVELDKPIYVSLPVKALCDFMDVKTEVIVTILAKGEQYAKEKGRSYYRFHNLLPEMFNIRFYNQKLEDLKKTDPLFAAIEKTGRRYTSLYKVQLLDLAQELGISPIEVPRELFIRQCQNKITYEADTECLCLEVHRITRDFAWLSEQVLAHMRKVESNTLSKLAATYILCRQSSYPSVDFILAPQKKGEEAKLEHLNEQLAKSSALIHKLNNVYFNSLEEECEVLLAGSEEEKDIINPLAHFDSPREKRDAESIVQDLLKTASTDIGMTLNEVDVLKVLLGISTKRITADRFKALPEWAKYYDYDHKELMQVIGEVFKKNRAEEPDKMPKLELVPEPEKANAGKVEEKEEEKEEKNAMEEVKEEKKEEEEEKKEKGEEKEEEKEGKQEGDTEMRDADGGEEDPEADGEAEDMEDEDEVEEGGENKEGKQEEKKEKGKEDDVEDGQEGSID